MQSVFQKFPIKNHTLVIVVAIPYYIILFYIQHLSLLPLATQF